KDGYNIQGLIDKMNSEAEYLPSAVEVEVLKQYYASLTEAINKNPTSENIKKRDDLLKSIDLVKVSQGRSIQAWDGLTGLEDNLANILSEERQYTELTQEQIKELSGKYEAAKKALDEYKKLQGEALEKSVNKKARSEVQKAKEEAAKTGNKKL